MDLKKNCSNCIKGTSIAVNNDILCRKNGAVSPDYVCSDHKLMPEPRSFKEMDYKCVDCTNFSFKKNSPNGGAVFGLCQLFSVRQFDGKQKKACSKFVAKVGREVS